LGPQFTASNKENPMSLGVLNNLSAVYAENNVNNTNSSLNTVLQQLSSGSKINSGADDAAGLSLVNGLQANQTALTQSETNASEGVGLLQVADGALSQVTSLLNRAVTLATEASNQTLNTTQDAAANQEYQSILSEIDNIGSTTTYNQMAVFGASKQVYTGDSSAAGASIDDLSIGTLTKGAVGQAGGTMNYSAGQSTFIDLSSATENAQSTDALAAGGTLAVTYGMAEVGGTLVKGTTTITPTTDTIGGLLNAINNSGLGITASFTTAGAAGDAAPTNNAEDTGIMISGDVQIAAPTSVGQIQIVQGGTAIKDSTTTGDAANVDGTTGTATISYAGNTGQDLSTTDLSSYSDAQSALTDLNTAIADVASQDGYIGAQINTLNAVSSVLSTQQENVQSAQNAVQATDYAQATSNMSKYEILGQTGIAALAQANSQQQDVLKLLQ
jgi:flagellin